VAQVSPEVGIKVMGQSLTGDIRSWARPQRRVGALLALIAAAVLWIAAIALQVTLKAAGNVYYWVIIVLLALVLAFMAALFVMTPKRAKAATMAELDPPMAASATAPAEGAPTYEPAATVQDPKVITLRCGDCGTIFDVTDTGERPLYHTCPGCGAEGALTSGAEAAPAPTPAPAVALSDYAPPAPAVVPKNLRLRCGGCKQIFSIEDTGERPLKRPCPHCGRMGQIS
jgi:DNA-directed RNA polymerase subunit RPC12/RpoP